MNYTTVEVELENGRVRPRGAVLLPVKAHALLTILEPDADTRTAAPTAADAGMRRFLAAPDFDLTPTQFRASMEADPFDQ
jgi:uncharacterized membrane protein YqiK